jgi:hypothetical protein
VLLSFKFQVSSFKLGTWNLKLETSRSVGWRWDAGRSVRPPHLLVRFDS